MDSPFSFSQFITRFYNDDTCLDEIKRMRFPKGIECTSCKKVTIHYKLQGRTAYTCKVCRTQCYPLAGTIFEKSTTPLRLWFYAMFLMTHTKGDISISQLQRELGVTYKTAWRMYTGIRQLMAQNNSDLLVGKVELQDLQPAIKEENKVFKWVFFKRIEFKVVQKKEDS